MQIEETYKLSAELAKIVDDSIKVVSESLSKTKFKKTGRALLAYIPKAGYIHNSILNCNATGGGYAAGILFRSLIEHSFRHLYIYRRALKDDSDDVGEEYYGKLKGSEDLEALAKMNNYTKLVHPDKTQWNLGGEHNKTITEVGKKFGISKIFVYLIDHFQTDKHIVRQGMKAYLLGRLKQYTDLSSYVHGGPYAEMCYEALIHDEAKMNTHFEVMSQKSLELYKSVIETTYLFASLFDEQMTPYYESVRKLGIQGDDVE